MKITKGRFVSRMNSVISNTRRNVLSNLRPWEAEPGRRSSSSRNHQQSPAVLQAQQRSLGRVRQGSGPGPGSSPKSGNGGSALHLSLCSTGRHILDPTKARQTRFVKNEKSHIVLVHSYRSYTSVVSASNLIYQSQFTRSSQYMKRHTHTHHRHKRQQPLCC